MNMTYINEVELQGVVSYVREEEDATRFYIHSESKGIKDGVIKCIGADISCECNPGTTLKDGQVVRISGVFAGFRVWVNGFLSIKE